MRFAELYARRQRRALTMAEAAEMLGVTERTFRRWSTRYEAEGMEGLEDRRLGRASARAVPVDEALQILGAVNRDDGDSGRVQLCLGVCVENRLIKGSLDKKNRAVQRQRGGGM